MKEKIEDCFQPSAINKIQSDREVYEMAVILNLPHSNRTELVNHLLAENSGQGALDAYQGNVLNNKIIELRDYIGEVLYLEVEGAANTFYPCIFPCSQKETVIEIVRGIHVDWHGAGALRSKFRFGTASWGSYPNFKCIEYCIQPNQTFIAALEQYTNQVSNPIFYLRGGYSYTIYTNNTILPKVSIYYEKTDAGREGYPFYVEPRTTIQEEFKSSIYPVQNQSLSTPLYGTVLTNTIPPKQLTTINELTLQAGTYIITAHIVYTSEFLQLVNLGILTGKGKQLVINRGTGLAGGGLSPFTIFKTAETVSIYSKTYQASDETRAINMNILTALRMA